MNKVKDLKLFVDLDELYLKSGSLTPITEKIDQISANYAKSSDVSATFVRKVDVNETYLSSSTNPVSNKAIDDYLSANYVKKVDTSDGRVGTIGLDYVKIRDMDSNLYRWMSISTDWTDPEGTLVWLDTCPETEKVDAVIDGVFEAKKGTLVEGSVTVGEF